MEYRLSTEILGHTGDVRSVTGFQLNGVDYIITGSRDKTACIWRRQDTNYILHKHLVHHGGYVSCVCVIPNGDLTRVLTGSQDNSILVHSVDPAVPDPLECYKGHKDLVSCLIYQDSELISGSWDSTIRVWKTYSQCTVLRAHEPAVWTLCGLFNFDGSKRFFSGGADTVIRLWDTRTSMCVQEYRGHTDVVRDVKVITSDVFLSASNDCTVRRWNIHTAHCLNELFGHEAFIYCLSPLLSSNGFASCGEDSTVRLWNDTECIQTIQLPCVSVWSVFCCPNGDIVVGSSDCVARVFTTDESRVASEQHIKNYLSNVKEFQSSRNKQSIDVKTLPQASVALAEPGKQTGDTKLVNNNGKAEVYQWNADTMEWEKIGDAVGQAPDTRKQYNGKDYDYLFDIEIDDDGPHMRKLKLPYNKTDDPYVAAEQFLTANNLPSWYLDQVADFIMKNADVQHVMSGVADPFTGGARYVPGLTGHRGVGTNDPFTGGSRYQPSDSNITPSDSSVVQKSSKQVDTNVHYPITSYQTFTSSRDYVSKIIGKLKEFSATHTELKLTADELSSIETLCNSVLSSTAPDLNQLPLLHRLLDWPEECVFPVLDIYRLIVLNESCARLILDQTSFIQKLHQLSCNTSSQSKNQLLVLKILVNSFVSSAEWCEAHIVQVFDIMTNLLSLTSKSHQVSLTTLLLNYYCYKSMDNSGTNDLVRLAIQILASPTTDSEAKYRVLVALGTLMSANKDIVLIQAESLRDVLAPLLDVSDPAKVSECAILLLETLL